MNSEHAQLLQRILNFNIDGSDANALPFAARLARENGWSRSYADRVVEEYKRYVFLAVTLGKPICPSEDVDAAWHLHLTYTRSYWNRFCSEILGRPLHHEPTKGGPAEAEKHLAMYAEALGAYRTEFGKEPPADIWSPADERFGDDLRHRAVNTARNWVVPKAPVKYAARLAVLFAAVALFVPGCNGGLNPFELVGTDFLYFLIPIMIGAVCLGRFIRGHFHGPAPREEDDETELNWEQAAYLAGGSARLTTAAIARLVANGIAAVEGTRLVRGGREVSDETTAVEVAVRNALPFSNEQTALKPVAQAVEAAFADEGRKLEAEGYLLPKLTQSGVVFASIIPLLLVLLAFAFPRLVLGFANKKPTDYLVFATVIGMLFSLGLIFCGYTRLTRRGEHVLAKLKARHRNLLNDLTWGETHHAGLAVALFGTAVLAGSSIAMLHTWYPRQTTGDSSGGCGTGGCGAGGDGGGGCGGCGGGGCGGGCG